jgi:DNA-binding response OmpR family regulator
VLANDQPLGLTPREIHVLRRLLKNAGRVVTKAQLTETLAALNEDIGDKTIEVYIHRIRHKIQGYDVEIVTVRGFGYLLRQIPSAG